MKGREFTLVLDWYNPVRIQLSRLKNWASLGFVDPKSQHRLQLSLDPVSLCPWHADNTCWLFLSTSKSHHHGSSSVTIYIFSGCLAELVPWLIVLKIQWQGWCPAPACAALLDQYLCSSCTLTNPTKLLYLISRGTGSAISSGKRLAFWLWLCRVCIKKLTEICLLFFCWYLGWGGERINRELVASSAELCASHPFSLSPSSSCFCAPLAMPVLYFHTDLETWLGLRLGYGLKLLSTTSIPLLSYLTVVIVLDCTSTLPKNPHCFTPSTEAVMGFRLEFTPTDCQFIAQNKASCPQEEFYLKTPTSYSSPVRLCRFDIDVQTYKNTSLAKTRILPLLLYNAIKSVKCQ